MDLAEVNIALLHQNILHIVEHVVVMSELMNGRGIVVVVGIGRVKDKSVIVIRKLQGKAYFRLTSPGIHVIELIFVHIIKGLHQLAKRSMAVVVGSAKRGVVSSD